MADSANQWNKQQTNSAEYKWCSAKSLSRLFKVTRSSLFVQTVRRGSWMRSVQWLYKWPVLVSVWVWVWECVCVCVCVFVWVVVGGWGSEFSDSWGKRGEGGARTGGSSASWQPGGWSCLSVCLSWLGDSSVSSLMVAGLKKLCVGWVDHCNAEALRVRRVL